MINRFFTSLRFVLNDSQLCVMAGVGWGWLAASLPTNPNQLLKLEIACHSEQSEESQIFYRTTMIKYITLDSYFNLAPIHDLPEYPRQIP